MLSASLVRESGALHGACANADFDVPLVDSVCLDGVPGLLQVGASALPSRCVGQRDEFRESDRLLAVSENLAEPGVSGGHSAWRSRVGGLRLRRQAHSRSGNFVVDSSSSSHHVDSARGNSGGQSNSYRCTFNSCGGVRGGTKPTKMITRCQVGCPAVEKLASLQQAPGRLHVETWAGRDGNPSLPISQAVEIMTGCADMVTRLLLLSSLTCHLGRAEKLRMG